MTEVHPTAIVEDGAQLGEGVKIGPFSLVGASVRVGDRSSIDSHVVLKKNTNIGTDCVIGVGSVIGGDAQDLKYQGEDSWVEIGNGTAIREYVTVNRGTAASGTTLVGERCYLMAYVHIAHDCVIGNDAIIANSVQLGGHVEVGKHAFIGGITPVHQFVKIGQYAFIGGGSRVRMDIPPFCKASGNPLRLLGPNSTGLERNGFSDDARKALKKAYRIMFNSSLELSEAVAQLESCQSPEVRALIDFVTSSERGVIR
jgi:UDP-N-acetylglucosamine acyltransferase